MLLGTTSSYSNFTPPENISWLRPWSASVDVSAHSFDKKVISMLHCEHSCNQLF